MKWRSLFLCLVLAGQVKAADVADPPQLTLMPDHADDQSKQVAVLAERVAWLERYIQIQLRETEKALALQASEYERRLEVLNHAHSEAIRVQSTYVRENEFDDNVLATDKRLAVLEIAQANEAGRMTVTIAVISFSVSVVVAILVRYIMPTAFLNRSKS